MMLFNGSHDKICNSCVCNCFQDQHEIQQHRFEVGMKLEAVDSRNGYNICPATVTEVIDSKYFIIEIDSLIGSDMEKRNQFCCHRNTPTIFPVNWAVSRSIKLASPLGNIYILYLAVRITIRHNFSVSARVSFWDSACDSASSPRGEFCSCA